MNANNSIQERGSEWRATAEAAMTIRILTELANEASGKRFNRSRAARIERWQQLAACAQAQASGLNALAKAPQKRPAKPRVITKEPDGIAPADAAAAAEAQCEAALNR